MEKGKIGLYDRIKEVSEQKKMSIYRVERLAELSNGTISKWNQSVPNAESILRVANVLDVTVEELMKWR